MTLAVLPIVIPLLAAAFLAACGIAFAIDPVGVGAAGLAGLLLLAAFALFYRSGESKQPFPGIRTALRGLRGLRRLHSGRVGDYILWLVWGALAFGIALNALFR